MVYRFLLNVNKNVWPNPLRYLCGNEKCLSSLANTFVTKEEIIRLTKRYFRQSLILPCPKPKQKLQDTIKIKEIENKHVGEQVPTVTQTKDKIIKEAIKAQEDVQAMSDQNTSLPGHSLAFQRNKEKMQAHMQTFQHPINTEISNTSVRSKKKVFKIDEDEVEEKDDEDLDPIIVTPKYRLTASKLMDRKEFIHNLNEIGAQKVQESQTSPKYKFVFEIKRSKPSKTGQDIQVEIKASESLKNLETNVRDVGDDTETFEVEAPEKELAQSKEAAKLATLNVTGNKPEEMTPATEYPNSNQHTIKPLQIATFTAIKHHEDLIKQHYQQLKVQEQNLQQADELVREHSRLKKLGKKR